MNKKHKSQQTLSKRMWLLNTYHDSFNSLRPWDTRWRRSQQSLVWWHQAITWTHADLFWIGRLEMNVSEIYVNKKNILRKSIHLKILLQNARLLRSSVYKNSMTFCNREAVMHNGIWWNTSWLSDYINIETYHQLMAWYRTGLCLTVF